MEASDATQISDPFPSTGVIYIKGPLREAFPQLEMALDRAYTEGGFILLAPGEHRLSKPLKIYESLTLIGPGPDQCRVTCAEYVAYFSSRHSSTAWYVKGVCFQHVGTAWANVLRVDSGKLTLENCVLTGAVLKQIFDQNLGGAGLLAYGNAEVKATNCRFFDNGLHGVEVAGSATVTLENNTCENNAYSGIAFFENGRGLVRGNVVTSNGRDGIQVCQSAAPTLIENRCDGNKRYGISFTEAATGIARDNICTGNVKGQIYVAPRAAPELVANSGEITKGTR
jgi:parallel beta-helix repeat protein